jgi:hypothetical protein
MVRKISRSSGPLRHGIPASLRYHTEQQGVVTLGQPPTEKIYGSPQKTQRTTRFGNAWVALFSRVKMANFSGDCWILVVYTRWTLETERRRFPDLFDPKFEAKRHWSLSGYGLLQQVPGVKPVVFFVVLQFREMPEPLTRSNSPVRCCAWVHDIAAMVPFLPSKTKVGAVQWPSAAGWWLTICHLLYSFYCTCTRALYKQLRYLVVGTTCSLDSVWLVRSPFWLLRRSATLAVDLTSTYVDCSVHVLPRRRNASSSCVRLNLKHPMIVLLW